VILVDTNVFVIELRYHRDPLFPVNRRFLRRLSEDGTGATTLFNVLELAGILSFNLNEAQLLNLLALFPERYAVAILPPLDLQSMLPQISQGAIARRIARRCAFGDALILEAAERYAPSGSCFVTWDSEHFTGRTALRVMTPKRALAAWPSDRRVKLGRGS
jgi:predicted nucleic acid-binding protein